MGSRRALITFALAACIVACKIVPKNPTLPGFNTVVHKAFHVEVQVRDPIAEVTVRPTFHNPNAFAIEGTYFLAVPPEAQIRDFRLVVGGKEIPAELLAADKARDTYREWVRSQKNPALLELVGTQMIKASIGTVPADGTLEVVVRYTALLPRDGGLSTLDIPFTNQFGADYPVPTVSVKVDISSDRGLKAVYSPTHALAVTRRSDREATATYEATNYSARKPFRLHYHASDEDLGLSLLTHRPEGEDGTFALLLTPRLGAEEKPLPRDILFVFDRSGSMTGEKIVQGREALATFIASLNDHDRFNIVDFSSDVNTFEPAPVEATRENRARATRYARGLAAAGSTNIDEALRKALEIMPRDPARLPMILFMTDGLPTVGEQRFDRILEGVRSKNGAASAARIFVFGVGQDVNTQFLDRLAEENRGARDYVSPDEKIEEKVSGLVGKISSPVLGNLALDFGGAEVTDVYPKTLPDLFRGTQLVVFGRFKGQGPATLTLKGTATGSQRTFRYEVALPAKDARHDSLPRLWASRKVAYLVDSIRLGGSQSREVIDEIMALGKRHGIITPYTSFLVSDDHALATAKAAKELKGAADRAEQSGRSASPPAASRQAQEDSKRILMYRDGGSLDSSEMGSDEVREKLAREGRKDVGVRTAGSATFFLRNGVWTDSRYDEKDKAKIVSVPFLSDDYFALAQNAGLAKLLAIGDSLIAVFEGKIYQVTAAK